MRSIRFIYHLWLVADFFIVAYWIRFTTFNPVLRRQRYVANTSRISRKFLKAFRINLNIKNEQALRALKESPYLLVANHTSYLDVILLASLENLSFITSVEMGNNYFLGPITRMGGSLFTNRKKPVSLKKEIENFSTAIDNGFKVVLFAEGTSTNGVTVKAFRSSLFQIAVNTSCPILPVCIKYKSLDSQPISPDNRDLIYWYGEMDFAPHFMKLLDRRIGAEIEILDSVVQIEGKTRAELSNEVFQRIHQCYHAEAQK
ncbi:MAG: lysophospholipid acyltransferase family protein [Candidatus Cloacimonetes bacterium]|nr:lysophospholipid acyltransferase family protein [Candidatus Cloacimonadota bacterium]MDD3578702.1 lysophospholipid acyltransferase family protein [Candidatus Cloacimonadota bacterium]HPF08878.1 lysophospholipid acyltransferase family protein [Candidatus Cloacimonadota bacterium]